MKFIPAIGKQFKNTPLFIGLAYALISAAWILISDDFLSSFIDDPDLLTEYQTYKGWFFVLTTAVLLYLYLRRVFFKIENAAGALIESENKYRSTIEQAVEGMIILDAFGNIKEANSAASEIMGYNKEDFEKLNLRDLLYNEDPEYRSFQIKELYSGNSILAERNFVQKGGSVIQAELSAKMLSTGDISLVFRDISKRKQIENELRESENEYRLLFKNNPHPMWVYDLETLRFIAVNNSAIDKYGYTQEEFLKKTIRDIRPQEEIPLLDKNLSEEDSYHQRSGPWTHRKKDGSLFYVEITSNGLKFRGRNARLVLADDITDRKKVLDALEEKEKRYRTLFEQSPISIWEQDLSIIKSHIDLLKRTGITDFNKYLEEYPEEIVNSISKVKILDINTATLDLFEAESKEKLIKFLLDKSNRSVIAQKETIVAISEGKKHFGFEKEIYTFTGKQKYVHFKWSVADGYENTYAKVFISLIDITQRKTAEDALKAVNRNLQEIIDASALPIYALDLEARIVFGWNRAAEELFGFTFAEVKNKLPLIVPDEELDRFRAFQKEILTGNTVSGVEVRRKTKEGKILTLIFSGAPLRDDKGSIRGSMTILSDVTQRKLFEQELKQSEAKYRDLSDSIRDVFFAIDTDSRVTYWNKATEEMSGIKAAEVIGRNLFSILPELKYTRFYDKVAKSRISESENIAQYVRMQGKDYYFDIYIYPSLTGYSVLAKDTTELKQTSDELKALNEELEQRVLNRTALLESSNKELEAFAYSVSHDLRAPLRRIDGFVNILNEENSEQFSKDSKGLVSSVLKNIREMEALINALLSFSKFAAKQLTLNKIDMNEMVKNISGELVRFEKARTIKVETADLPAVYCDATLIQQVWINLISNALKFTRQNEETIIKIDCRSENGFAVFKVCDNGIGFNPTYNYRLFDVFQRLHRKEDFEGSGIGLAIVKRIVTRHKGKVWAESIPGNGACFYFSIPEYPENK